MDSGEWRERGVSHWHLVRTEWGMHDRERFDGDRVSAARMRATDGVARSPGEVVAWLGQEAPRTEYGDELAFWSAMRGQDCHRLRRLSDRRIAHVDAYAMTSAMCGCDRSE